MQEPAPAAPPLQIYFMRHSETAWSLSGQHTGRTDLALTAHGEELARRLGSTLRGLAFTRVLTSPRLRAGSTCALAGCGEAAHIEPRLAEWDYGVYEGLRTAEIEEVRPGWDVWLHGCPCGETPEAVSQRADALIADLRQLSGKVALFSHGQFGRVLAARWLGLPVAQGRHFAIDPASLGILGSQAGHRDTPVIALWNAVSTPRGSLSVG